MAARASAPASAPPQSGRAERAARPMPRPWPPWSLPPWPRLLLLAALLRVALVLYGAWHDERFEVRYTDIDYDVFSDGAELVWRGRSPFERPTYRYTPLLALLLTPNAWLHPAWGKALFSLADLAVGAAGGSQTR